MKSFVNKYPIPDDLDLPDWLLRPEVRTWKEQKQSVQRKLIGFIMSRSTQEQIREHIEKAGLIAKERIAKHLGERGKFSDSEVREYTPSTSVKTREIRREILRKDRHTKSLLLDIMEYLDDVAAMLEARTDPILVARGIRERSAYFLASNEERFNQEGKANGNI